jgi:hypothetical protein
VAGGFAWYRGAYGEDAFQRSLARLSAEDRATFGKAVVSLGWYSVAALERVFDAQHAEAHALTGISREDFDLKGSSEVGSSMVRSVYRFFLSLMSTESFLQRAAALQNRLYEPFKVEVVESRPGFARVSVHGAPEMRAPAQRFFRPLLNAMARTGAKDIELAITRDEVSPETYAMEYTLSYR